MGRKHTRNEKPQKARQSADPDMWHKLNLPTPRAFGIRRQLETGISNSILQRMIALQDEGDIPNTVEIRRAMHVTLLPQRTLTGQAVKGLVGGQCLEKLKNGSNDRHTETVGADISGVGVYKARIINVKLQSSVLENERADIADTLGSLGLRGVQRSNQETMLHMSIGETRKNLSVTEQRHVQHVVEENLQELASEIIDLARYSEDDVPEQFLQFNEWKIYPDPNRLMR